MKAAGWGLLLAASLAGCGVWQVQRPGIPSYRPTTIVQPVVQAPAPAPQTRTVSAQSAALISYYARLQSQLVSRGLMRTDGGERDAPFTDTTLANNLLQIAFYDEYQAQGGALQARATQSRLRRWAQPISMSVQFGPTTEPAHHVSDRAIVGGFAAKLSGLTQLPITVGGPNPNFHVLFLTEDDRRASESLLRGLLPSMSDSSLRYALNLPTEQLCLVIATFGPDGVTYDRAVAIIRDEHPSLMRLACIHEELAQGLGLANDSPQARPSIFNDDEEFALLTPQDALMLQILYDRRLRIGMSEAEAAPIVRYIAASLVDG